MINRSVNRNPCSSNNILNKMVMFTGYDGFSKSVELKDALTTGMTLALVNAKMSNICTGVPLASESLG